MALMIIAVLTSPVWGGLLAVIPTLRRPHPVAGGSRQWLYS